MVLAQVHAHFLGDGEHVVHALAGLGDVLADDLPIDAHRAALDSAPKVIIDLRFTHDGEEEAFLPLMPYILSERKTMSEAAGVQTLCTLYTEANCHRRAALLAPYAQDHAARALLAGLEEKRGAGWLTEEIGLWADETQAVPTCGRWLCMRLF